LKGLEDKELNNLLEHFCLELELSGFSN